MNRNPNSLTAGSDKNAKHAAHARTGAMVVLFALILPVLIIILGFSIDYANIQRVRNEAQVVADLASKAAADTLARTDAEDGVDPLTVARQAAKDVAAANFIGGELHSLDDADIIFGRAAEQADGSFQFIEGQTPANSVRVNAARTPNHPNGRLGLFFGQFYGNPDIDLQQTATSSFRDVEICLVLDRSGSMKLPVTGTLTPAQVSDTTCQPPGPDSRWIALDSAISVFLGVLDSTPNRERIGMVTFAADGTNVCTGEDIAVSTLDQTLTTITNRIRNAMNDYQDSIWHGGTDITAGLQEAKDHMINNGNPQRREQFIVLLTDGAHNGDVAPFDLATQCAEAGIVVHTITFSSEANIEDMVQVATNGGGQHNHADNSTELENIFRRLAGSFAILTE